VFELFEHTWPGIGARAAGVRGWGMRWEESTPFVAFSGERVIAHVGVLPMNLVVAGNRMRVGGIHAVATHLDHRGKGRCRALYGMGHPQVMVAYSVWSTIPAKARTVAGSLHRRPYLRGGVGGVPA
jgi:hypothetical protein